MYRLSNHDFDPGVFVGSILEGIYFTENTVHFAFDGYRSITLDSSYELRRSGEVERSEVPPRDKALPGLVGHIVIQCSIKEEGRILELEFDDGHALAFVDDSSQYESFRIGVAGREIVV